MEKKREGRSSDADNKQSVTRRVIILSLDVRVRLYASLPRVICGIHYVWYVVEFARVSRVYASVCDNTRWLKNTTRPTCRSRKFLLALKTFRRDVLLVDNYARLSFFYFLLFFLLFSFFFFHSPLRIHFDSRRFSRRHRRQPPAFFPVNPVTFLLNYHVSNSTNCSSLNISIIYDRITEKCL